MVGLSAPFSPTAPPPQPPPPQPSQVAITDPKEAREARKEAEAVMGREAISALAQAMLAPPSDLVPAPAFVGGALKSAFVRLDPYRYEPRDPRQLYVIAQFVAKSGLFRCDNPASALIIMMTGAELGLTVAQSLRAIHIIEGRPALSSHLHAALIIRSGLCEDLTCVATTNQYAHYRTKRKGKATCFEHGWTIQQAMQAELQSKANWRHHTAAMLRSRAVTELARIEYPDVVLGLYDPDELGAPVTVYEPGPRELPVIDVLAFPTQPTKPPEQVAQETAEAKARLDAMTLKR